VILCHWGEYQIVETDLGSIRGKGKLLVNESRGEYRDWEGAIAFTEIERITDTEITTLGKVTLISTASAVVLLLLFLATFRFEMH